MVRLFKFDFRKRQKLLLMTKEAYGRFNQLDTLRLADETLQVDPYCFEAYNFKARAFHRLQQYDDALQAIDEAVARLPAQFKLTNNVYVRNIQEDRGNILDSLYRPREAAASFNMAIDKGRKSSWLHYRAALCYCRAGQFDLALSYIRRAIQLNVEDKELAAKKLYDKQIEILLRANLISEAATLAAHPNAQRSTIVFFLAGLHAEHMQKQPNAALTWYKMCIHAHPTFQPAREALTSLCAAHQFPLPDLPPRSYVLRASDINIDLEVRGILTLASHGQI